MHDVGIGQYFQHNKTEIYADWNNVQIVVCRRWLLIHV